MYRAVGSLTSIRKLIQSMKDWLSFSKGDECDEKSFRSLLENESKRSDRSGYFCQVLLVFRISSEQRIVPMGPGLGRVVMARLSQCLRETDYVGWYRQDLVVGGVLTAVGKNHTADLFDPSQRSLLQILQSRLGAEEASRLRVIVCQPHELGQVKLGLDDIFES